MKSLIIVKRMIASSVESKEREHNMTYDDLDWTTQMEIVGACIKKTKLGRGPTVESIIKALKNEDRDHSQLIKKLNLKLGV